MSIKLNVIWAENNNVKFELYSFQNLFSMMPNIPIFDFSKKSEKYQTLYCFYIRQKIQHFTKLLQNNIASLYPYWNIHVFRESITHSFGTVSYFSCFENNNDTPTTTVTTPWTYVNGMDIAPPPDLKTCLNSIMMSSVTNNYDSFAGFFKIVIRLGAFRLWSWAETLPEN